MMTESGGFYLNFENWGLVPDRLEKGSCLTQDCKLSPNARFNLFVNVQPTAVSFLSIVSFRHNYIPLKIHQNNISYKETRFPLYYVVYHTFGKNNHSDIVFCWFHSTPLNNNFFLLKEWRYRETKESMRSSTDALFAHRFNSIRCLFRKTSFINWAYRRLTKPRQLFVFFLLPFFLRFYCNNVLLKYLSSTSM